MINNQKKTNHKDQEHYVFLAMMKEIQQHSNDYTVLYKH